MNATTSTVIDLALQMSMQVIIVEFVSSQAGIFFG